MIVTVRSACGAEYPGQQLPRTIRSPRSQRSAAERGVGRWINSRCHRDKTLTRLIGCVTELGFESLRFCRLVRLDIGKAFQPCTLRSIRKIRFLQGSVFRWPPRYLRIGACCQSLDIISFQKMSGDETDQTPSPLAPNAANALAAASNSIS